MALRPALHLLDRSNLMPWCWVPYDTVDRSAAQRAALAAGLGFTKVAWDWRDEHTAGFGEHIDQFAAHDIAVAAIWAPHVLPTEGDGGLGAIQPLLREHIDIAAERSIAPALWACTEFGPPGAVEPLASQTQRAMVERTAEHLAPLAAHAASHGMDVELYPHLGWAGEPDNLIEVIEALRSAGHRNVALVYHLHHGHHHLDDFAALFARMRPYLRAFGMNGTVRGRDWGDGKVHPVGHGELDLDLLRTVVTSGWEGPLTVLSHTMDDAEARLRDNLAGLDWLRQVLEAETHGTEAPPGPPPAQIPHPVWPH